MQKLTPNEQQMLDILKSLYRRDKFYANLTVSEHGQVPEDAFLRVHKKPYKAFSHLSQNEAISFDLELLERYRKDWNWHHLLYNQAVPWNEALITQFYDEIAKDLKILSRHPKLEFSIRLGEQYENIWDWTELSKIKGDFWIEELIQHFEAKWYWNYLSENPSLPWSYELIERYSKKWNWEKISHNQGIKPLINETFYKKYHTQLKETWLKNRYERPPNTAYYEAWQNQVSNNPNWETLSGSAQEAWILEYLHKYRLTLDFEWFCQRKDFNWTKSLIDSYPSEWAWYYLSENPRLQLDEELLQSYLYGKHNLSTSGLSRNTGILWRVPLLEKVKSRFQAVEYTWEEFCESASLSEELIRHFADEFNWEALSRNTKIKWTEELINRFTEHWHWNSLSANPSLPWSEDFIRTYQDKWHWGDIRRTSMLPKIEGLPGNKGIHWDLSLIHAFREQIDIGCLADSSNGKWQASLLHPHLSKAVVRAYYDFVG